MIGKSDTTLAAMLWEEGLAPADAAEHWGTSSVTRRIKRLYANRLGGNWDLEGTGPVANWRRQIAEVRNSAIHTGREVTSGGQRRRRSGRCAHHVYGAANTGQLAKVPEDDVGPSRTVVGRTARLNPGTR